MCAKMSQHRDDDDDDGGGSTCKHLQSLVAEKNRKYHYGCCIAVFGLCRDTTKMFIFISLQNSISMVFCGFGREMEEKKRKCSLFALNVNTFPQKSVRLNPSSDAFL